MSAPNRFFDMVTGADSDTTLPTPASAVGEDIAPDTSSADVASTNMDHNPIVDSALPEPMPSAASRVLVHLMRHGVIFHTQKPNLYDTLCQYQTLIQRHLSEVYLNLVLDERQGLAFIARFDYQDHQHSPNLTDIGDSSDSVDEPTTDDGEPAPSLISKRTLSLYDTLILLMLRKYYQERETSGEQTIIIDIERLSSLLTPFLPLTDHASKDLQKLSGRLKEFSRRHLLSSVRGTDERYEITPLIRYVVSADFLDSMLTEYSRLANDSTDGDLASAQSDTFDRENVTQKPSPSSDNKPNHKVSEVTSNHQKTNPQSDLFGE